LPSVDSQSSRGLYWSGAHYTTPPFTASQLHSLPSPPSSEAGRSLGPTRDTTANVAAAVAHPSSMHPGSDPMGAPPSFATRRPHAQQLGSFELPPPTMHKYPFTNTVTASHSPQAPTTIASVGNLLTPPNTNHSDLLSSSGVSTTNAQYSTTMAYSNGQYMYSPPTQASTAHYGYPTAHHQQNQYSQARGGMFAPPRSDGQIGRQDSLGKGLNPPPYEMNQQLPPFTPSSNGSNMPSISTQHHQQQHQHQHQHQQHQQQQQQQQQHHHQQMMSAQTPVSSSAPQQSPALSQDSFRPPQPPTPTYSYHASGTPQHSNFPYSTGPSPTLSQQQSPISAGGSMPRMSPAVSQGSIPSIPSNNPAHSPYQYQQRPPLQYSGGQPPVFSNVQNTNGGLSLVGGHPMMPGFNSGHAAAMPHFMGHPQHQQPTTNDRPFKCDQCPQSFNRNHDLKRHKRIHLAVKPFPCNHCDKSFSRKDALKVRLMCSIV